MKIKAKTCDENFLEEIKRNFDTKYIDLYRNFDKKGIQELFNDELVYDIEHEFEYLELFDPKSFSDLFTNNIKKTYESLKFLTPVQASREEFWFTMINTIYLDYLLSYLKTVSNRKDFDQKIKNSIFSILQLLEKNEIILLDPSYSKKYSVNQYGFETFFSS